MQTDQSIPRYTVFSRGGTGAKAHFPCSLVRPNFRRLPPRYGLCPHRLTPVYLLNRLLRCGIAAGHGPTATARQTCLGNTPSSGDTEHIHQHTASQAHKGASRGDTFTGRRRDGHRCPAFATQPQPGDTRAIFDENTGVDGVSHAI